MAGDSKDLLLQLSAALASATASAQSSVVAIRAPRSPPLSGTRWRNNLVVASEQVFPQADAAEIVLADGAAIHARVAGRDPGTNIVALQLESPIEFDRPEPADPDVEHGAEHIADGVARPHRHAAGERRHRQPGTGLAIEPGGEIAGVGLDPRKTARGAGTDPCCGCPGRTAGASRDR